MIPESLYWILRWIIANPEKEVHDELTSPECNSHAGERRVLMLAQDIVHCAPHGRLKTPKQVSIAMSVRHLTRSKQLVTRPILNKMVTVLLMTK